MMIKVYLNHYRQFFNTNGKKMLLFLSIMIISFLSIITGNSLTGNIINVFLSGKTSILYAAIVIYLLIESMGVVLIFVLLKYVTNDSTDILKVLSRLPIKPLTKYVSYYLFQIIVETFTPIVFSMIILLPRLIAKGFEVHFIIELSLILIVQALMISLLMNFIYNVLLKIFKEISLPYPRNLSLFIQIILSIISIYYSQKMMFMNLMKAQINSFRYDILYWHAGFIYKSLVSNKTTPSYILMASVSLAVIVGGILSFGLLTNGAEESHNRIFYRFAQPKTTFKNLLVKDFKLLTRHEDIIFLIVTLMISVVMVRLFSVDNTFYLTIIKLFFGILGSLALFSYGSELSMMLLYRRLGVSKLNYLLSKFTSCLVLTMIIDLLFCLLSVGRIEFSDLFSLYITSILSCFFSFIVGLLFPFSKNSSTTQIHLLIVVFIMLLPLNYCLKLVNSLGDIEKGILCLSLGISIILLGNNKFKEDWNGELL